MASSRKGFKVWSGNDGDTFLVMALGGYGVISVTSHLVGNQIKKMIELCVMDKFEEARAMHHKLMRLNNGLFIVTNPVPIKHAFAFLGCSMGKTRLPLTEPDENSRKILERIVGSYEPDLPLLKKK
jgi:4-hydroxy-tetrahydrodipicolinate synthase